MIQQQRFLVKALTGIRLKEKRGTWRTDGKERLGEAWISPFPSYWSVGTIGNSHPSLGGSNIKQKAERIRVT